MIRKSLLIIALLSSLTLQAEDTTVGQSNNKGLLGNTYVIAYIGTTKYGDDETADMVKSNSLFGVSGSFKATENVSLGLSVETITADMDYNGVTGEVSGTAFSLGALYHFLPNETIDPYISLGIASISTKVDLEYQGDTYGSDESDNGYSLSAGAEFDLSDKVFLTPSASYSKVGDGDASKGIALRMEFEVNKQIYLGGRISMDLDETDTSYLVAVGGKF